MVFSTHLLCYQKLPQDLRVPKTYIACGLKEKLKKVIWNNQVA